MPIDLGTQGQPNFNQPIELMMDCHRRIEHFLAVLQRVVQRYATSPLDDQGREALTTASQTLKENWLTADYRAKRRILEIVCLNFSLDDVSLVPTIRKPFDVLAEGLDSAENRGGQI